MNANDALDLLDIMRRMGQSNESLRFAHEQLGLWQTIGGHPQGDKKHVGGTPVKIDPQGKIEAGPAALKGKKVDELKGEKKEPTKAPAKTPESAGNTTYFKGDKAVFTGRTESVGGQAFHEVKIAEGPDKGQTRLVPSQADKEKNVEQKRQDWQKEQEDFRRLAQAQNQETLRQEKSTEPKPETAAPTSLFGKVAEVQQSIQQNEQRQRAQRQRLVEDFGEKIGGARKDIAVPLGPRPKNDQGEVDERPAWRKKYHVGQDAKSGKWFIAYGEKPSDEKRMLDRMYGRGVDYDTKEEAEKAVPLMEVGRNHRVHEDHNDKGKWSIRRKVSDRKMPAVKGGFASRDDAMRYMAQHPGEIIEHKFPFPTRPWLDRVERTGKSHHAGDIKPQQFHQAFGFRGGEFGNWNAGGDGQAALNHAYDALHDLADVLKLPPKALSLDGKLAISFGARGHGGKDAAAAHYERDKAVINLTKIKGAGSLAHEWFHAMDHYVGKLSGKKGASSSADRAGDYASHGLPYQHTARKELADAWKNVIDTLNAKKVEKEISADFEKKRVAGQDMALRDSLDNLERHVADDARYNKRHKPLTPEQKKKWDELKSRIIAGDVGKKVPVQPEGGKSRMLGRDSYEAVRELNAIYKAATGRSFDLANQESPGARLFWQIGSAADAQKRLAEAEKGAKETKKAPTDFFNEARKLDNTRASDYWGTPHEMGARAFESYINDKIKGGGNLSQYLVHGAENKWYDEGKPYPEGEERQAFNAAFDRLFEAIKHEEREDEKGKHVKMFSALLEANAREMRQMVRQLDAVA